MTTQRQTTGNRLTGPKNGPAVKKYPARRFPIQHEIQKLEDELNAFNERIAELEEPGSQKRNRKAKEENSSSTRLDFIGRA